MKLSWFQEFMNTFDEWHCFCVGYCEVISIHATTKRSKAINNILLHDYWYYLFGRALGIISWIGIILGCIKIIGG